VPQQRIQPRRGVGDAVAVAPPDRPEAGVEVARRGRHRADREITGQRSTQSGQHLTGSEHRETRTTGSLARSTRVSQVSSSPWTVRSPG
jgi:hypothetical protein